MLHIETRFENIVFRFVVSMRAYWTNKGSGTLRNIVYALVTRIVCKHRLAHHERNDTRSLNL